MVCGANSRRVKNSLLSTSKLTTTQQFSELAERLRLPCAPTVNDRPICTVDDSAGLAPTQLPDETMPPVTQMDIVSL